jgi:hypothetical protein
MGIYGSSRMRHFFRCSISIVLMGIALNTFAEQKKCILLNTGESINEFREKISEECSPGDVLYYRDTVGADIRVILAATVCDFSKSIVFDDEELACIYNGIATSK